VVIWLHVTSGRNLKKRLSERKLEWRDYISFIIALLTTSLLPLVIFIIIFILLAIIIGRILAPP
jgi:hypothetical protein